MLFGKVLMHDCSTKVIKLSSLVAIAVKEDEEKIKEVAMKRKRKILGSDGKDTVDPQSQRFEKDKLKTTSNSQAARSSPPTKIVKSSQNVDVKHKEERTYMPKSDLKEELFDLFEEHPYWSLSGIVERIPQPESYVNEVLDEIAVLLKWGPYLGKYQLKTGLGLYSIGYGSRPRSCGTARRRSIPHRW
ncbi:hypothetical protein BGX28_004738 [Mortierella sp. GBA30]|nr:hypothetical protein BGX28_004738 [Mortierella sp. GBA30]